MAVSFTHLSWWTWSGKHPRISQAPSRNSTLESDTLKLPLRANMTSSSRRAKRKWHSREERKAGIEYDMVVVSSDDGCLSGSSESDGSDWSIGWLEPHGHEFQSDAEKDNDNSFAVLVPCYRRNYSFGGDLSRRTNYFCPSPTTHDCYSEGSKNSIEQWLSSLQNR